MSAERKTCGASSGAYNIFWDNVVSITRLRLINQLVISYKPPPPSGLSRVGGGLLTVAVAFHAVD